MTAKAVYDETREKRETCRSCGAPMVMRFNTTSRRYSPWDVPGDDGAWVSHFATCPTADQHRKPKPEQRNEIHSHAGLRHMHFTDGAPHDHKPSSGPKVHQ